MFASRQLRLRVLDALEQRIKQFLRREELWPLRVPREPLLLDHIIRQALPVDHGSFDLSRLRARTLLSLGWADGSRWEAWVAVLPSGFKVYCDSGEQESRVLASGGRNDGDASDRAFLELFAESAGRHFGIEMSGGAPCSVRSPMAHEFLVELFVNLFEIAGTEDSVREQLAEDEPKTESAPHKNGQDFRAEVEAWIALARRRPAVTSSPES